MRIDEDFESFGGSSSFLQQTLPSAKPLVTGALPAWLSTSSKSQLPATSSSISGPICDLISNISLSRQVHGD